MDINRISILAKRVILQVLADRRTLALIIFVPVILLTFAGVLIRLEPGTIKVGVVNVDQGFSGGGNEIKLGDRLVAVLQTFDIFTAEILTADQAQAKIEAGELDALITLPENFTSQVMQTRELTLNIQFEGSNPMVAERLRGAFERVGTQTLNSMVMVQGSQPAEVTIDLQTSYLHGGAEFDTLDYMASALIGVFVFLFVFILTSISFLRERLAGTLERLQATPIRSHEIIVGYMLGFLFFGLLQGIVTLLYTVFVLKIHYHGNLLNVFIVESLLVVASVNLGIFFSTFARNEFQVLQFIPLVVVTQVFLGGVFWEVSDMPSWLQPLAYVMPLTHANQALRAIMMKGAGLDDLIPQIAALVLIGLGIIALSSRTAGRVRI